MASLTQRSGALGKRLAAHLLRRTTYHITKARIDAFALKTADQAVDELLLEGKRINSNYFLSTGTAFQPDLPTLVATNYSTPENADALVIQVLETMLPEMPEGYTIPGDVSKRYNYFREALLGGLSTINWMFEWQNAQAGDPNAQASVDVALDRLFEIVMSSPEFQTF